LRGCAAQASKKASPAVAKSVGTFVAHGAGMSKPIPTVQKYMTTSPHTIGADQTLAQAHALLKQYKIRHLPVLKGSELLGMLTERDLALIETLRDVDPHTIQVEEAMSTGVYTVSPEAKLDEVVGEMAEKKYGSAVVVQNGKVVGILTTVDVCCALAELLRGRLGN
jgi:acetoin utilization protein AcuB